MNRKIEENKEKKKEKEESKKENTKEKKVINKKKFSIIVILIIAIDQIIKIILQIINGRINSQISSGISGGVDGSNIILIPNILKISYCKNTGGAFSIFNKNILFLILFSLFAICFIIYLLKNINFKKEILFSLYFILGGAIGNLIDRIFRGFVLDYLDFYFLDFPVFNFADICIFCGIFSLGFFVIRDILNNDSEKNIYKKVKNKNKKRKEKKKESKNKEN